MFKFKNITKEERAKKVVKAQRLMEFLESKDMKVFINFGSLLGAIRENGLILEDNDIDICYISKFNKKEEVFRECQELKHKCREWGMLKAFFSSTKHSADEEADCYGQFHLWFEGLGVDLFTQWIDEEGNYWMHQWGNLGKIEIEPFREVLFEGVGVKVPKESEKILEALYGQDWKTPKAEKIRKYRERGIYLL